MITEKQKEILTASIKLASRKGIQSLTIKNISSEIGVTEAALYRHFKSKRDILLGIIELFSTSSKNDFESSISSEASSIKSLKGLIFRRIEAFERFPEIAYIMLSIDIFMQDDNLRLAAIGSIHKHKDYVIKLISEGQASGEIKQNLEPKELFRIIIGSFRLLLTQWFLNKYSFHLKAEFESLWNTINSLIKA